jgi:hypothetical protein
MKYNQFLYREIQDREKRFNFLEETNRRLKIRHEEDLSNIQRTVFQKVAETYTSKTDHDLQMEIRKLRNGITSWAKKWARVSLDHLSPEDLAFFKDHLRKTILRDPDEIIFEKFIHNQKFLNLLLSALLSYALHWNIIRNPFFIRKPREHCDIAGANPVVFLNTGYIQMYARMKEGKINSLLTSISGS